MQVPTVTSRPTCSQSGLQVCMTKGELGNPARPRLAHSRAGQGRAGQGRAGQGRAQSTAVYILLGSMLLL